MWLFLGLASGFFHALMSMVSKKALKDVNQYLAAFAYAAFSIPFFLISLIWLDLTSVNSTFWWAAVSTALLNVIAITFFMKALSIGELSLTVPFLSFSPIFLIFTSNLMLGEFPTSFGVLGILLIVAGTYFLELKKEQGVLSPFKALLHNQGAQLVLLVALIYAVTSNLDKIAIQNSNPITRILVVQAIMSLALLLLIRFKSNQKMGIVTSNYKILLPIGFFMALAILAQMTALTLTIVPYVISLKRTSAFFSIILGFIAFKERNVKPKLLGVVLMMAGVFLISLS